MAQVNDQSIDLVVTSPPYPMIQLWDDQFSQADDAIAKALSNHEVKDAFEAMHTYLDSIWKEVARILKWGGIACINIGDATRSFNGHFQLFANHARIITAFTAMGFYQLPAIIWRKPTNAPNKFMGSGMYPPGAYVTLEHEYILIFRKGTRRSFSNEADMERRRRSAYFWEERNVWFSDVWTDLRGTPQNLKTTAGRNRSGAFPLELPFRLINMFSVKGDSVLDPFLGTGTTLQAAMCAGRNAIGYELAHQFHPLILENMTFIPAMANNIVQTRLQSHYDFIKQRIKTKGNLKHLNRNYGFAVMTRQEEDLQFHLIENIQYLSGHHFKVSYTTLEGTLPNTSVESHAKPVQTNQSPLKARQMKLF